MDDRWGQGPPAGAGPLEELIHLSRCVGADVSLVQAGGGNSSLKATLPGPLGRDEDTLVVKGSGADMRDIDAAGFAHLSRERLRQFGALRPDNDEQLVEFMSACMLYPRRDPLPSVEASLHAILPQRVLVHTHDVASLALTSCADDDGQALIRDVFQGRLAWLPYVRSGAPLARALLDRVADLGPDTHGLVLAHHGLVVWGEDAATCYRRLLEVVRRGRAHIAAQRPARHAFGEAAGPPLPGPRRRALAATIMPVIRGALGGEDGVILNLDDAEPVLDLLARGELPRAAGRGVATPEHILRAGRLPLTLALDAGADDDAVAAAVRRQLADQQAAYEAYHRRHAAAGSPPLEDWAKTVLVPGVGLITAFRDRTSARVARDCYRSVLEIQAAADALGAFRFIPEEEVFHFEHWPLERRKVTEAMARERATQQLRRHVGLILGGGSGIGEAAAHRFAEHGAHVVVGDLDGARADAVATAIDHRHPGRAVGVAVDVRREEQILAAVERTVLEYGGLDSLFYTPGLAPRFAPLAELTREDLQVQVEVNYLGALLAVRAAAAVMRRQGRGGAIICSVSKAALAPGREAAAYGGSKAGLQHALRVAALELGGDGIRVNSINADQVETPLFLRFAAARAAARGISLEEQLAGYRQRNALGVSLIPAAAVAELAVLLAGEPFRYTTGDIITIDGGLSDAFPR